MKILISLFFSIFLLISSAYCENLKYISINIFGKSASEINTLIGSTITLEAWGAYDTNEFKEYSSKNDPCIWSTSNALLHINDKGTFYCKKPGTVRIIATKGGRSAMITLNITTEPSQAMPATPTGLKITDITSRSAIATWNNAKYKDTIYIISIGTDEIAVNGGVPYTANSPYKLTWNIPVAHGFESNQTFYVKVMAANRYGTSDWCKPVQFKTLK